MAGRYPNPKRSRRYEHQQSRRDRYDAYRLRFLGCLATSVILMIAAVHLPLDGRLDQVGWHVIRPSESITVNLDSPRPENVLELDGAPITRIEEDGAEAQPEGNRVQKQPEPEVELHEPRARLERISGRRVFNAAHDMPTIVGGLGAYYIHIEYPDEALRDGIQGSLLLSFIVETDGRTSGVQVIRSLHPACDSAAVRALRRTRFVPGRHGGEVVPVRMHLPVRFQIVDWDEGLSEAQDAEG